MLLTPLADLHAAVHGIGPVQGSRFWPLDVRAAFPGRHRRLEAWTGEGAAFARYDGPHGPLFLKYLPAGWSDAAAHRRLRRETAFLRELAPHMPVRHAPLLHADSDTRRLKAHLFTRDLTASTTGWGAFGTPQEKERALHDLVSLMARFHGFWHGPGRAHLVGSWAWSPDKMVRHAQEIARSSDVPSQASAAVQEAASQLPELLAAADRPTLAHGDLHAGQVLWTATGDAVLIDYGQVHPSVPGEDLAHVLGVRLAPADRQRLQGHLLTAYREALAAAGCPLTESEVQGQYRAGLAVNLIGTARQASRNPGRGVAEALANVLDAWQARE